MADNQKEKLSPEQLKQRNQINFLVEKASKSDKGVTKIMIELNKKSYYFRQVVSMPLKQEFISFIKSQFGVDIIKELAKINSSSDSGHEVSVRISQLERELSETRRKLNDALEKLIEKENKKPS
jgi:vacuolar-type H+-ATPase subunit I/STV1